MIRNQLLPGFLVDTTEKTNVYLLGFLWADGWIQNKGYTHLVGISIVKDDFVGVEVILRSFGVNAFYERQRIQNGKPFGRVSRGCAIQSGPIVDFLLDNNYDKKSGCAPSKILSVIPRHLKHYFWRGYLDGDGCIYVSRKKEISFWSVIDQNWSELIKLTTELEVPYQIYTYSRKGGRHQSSVFRMGGIDNLVKFGDHLYQNYDGIGLKRKYEKYILLKEFQKIVRRKTSKYVGVFLCSRSGKWGANEYDPLTKKQRHLGWFTTENEAYLATKFNSKLTT